MDDNISIFFSRNAFKFEIFLLQRLVAFNTNKFLPEICGNLLQDQPRLSDFFKLVNSQQINFEPEESILDTVNRLREQSTKKLEKKITNIRDIMKNGIENLKQEVWEYEIHQNILYEELFEMEIFVGDVAETIQNDIWWGNENN